MSIINLNAPFPMPPGATKPKFKTGDSVRIQWQCDDRLNKELYGKPIRVDGYITGAIWSDPYGEPGWIYLVLVEESTYDDEPLQAIEFGENDLNLRRSARTGANRCESVWVSQNTRSVRPRGGENL